MPFVLIRGIVSLAPNNGVDGIQRRKESDLFCSESLPVGFIEDSTESSCVTDDTVIVVSLTVAQQLKLSLTGYVQTNGYRTVVPSDVVGPCMFTL